MVGPVVGPPLGGFITTYFDWRWIFFINIPIGILGIVLSTLLHSEHQGTRERRPSTSSASCCSGFGFALLMLGLATGGRHLIPIEASIGCVVARRGLPRRLSPARAPHAPSGAAPRASLKSRPSGSASLGGFLFRIGVGAIPFLLPLMLQLGFGLNPLHSGSLTFMAAAGAMFTKTLAKRVLQIFGFRRLLTVNAFVGVGLPGASTACSRPRRPIG